MAHVGEAEFDVKQRGTFAKDGTIYPSMYVTEEYNTIQLPQDTYPEAYLTCINPVSNNYKFYHFRPSGSVLNATYGRIGAGRGEAFDEKVDAFFVFISNTISIKTRKRCLFCNVQKEII